MNFAVDGDPTIPELKWEYGHSAGDGSSTHVAAEWKGRKGPKFSLGWPRYWPETIAEPMLLPELSLFLH